MIQILFILMLIIYFLSDFFFAVSVTSAFAATIIDHNFITIFLSLHRFQRMQIFFLAF